MRTRRWPASQARELHEPCGTRRVHHTLRVVGQSITMTVAPTLAQLKSVASGPFWTWTQPWLWYGPSSEPGPYALAGSHSALWMNDPSDGTNSIASWTTVSGYPSGFVLGCH